MWPDGVRKVAGVAGVAGGVVSSTTRHASRRTGQHVGMEIRDATAADWPAIWPIFEAVVRAGETYAYDLDTGDEEGRALWMAPAPARVAVAVDEDGAVLGTSKMSANREGNGAHVATA